MFIAGKRVQGWFSMNAAHCMRAAWTRYWPCRLTALTAILAMQGCGVTIDAKRVAPDMEGKMGTVIPGQGIVSGLVRTKFELVQPVVLTPASKAPLADIFDDCLRTCEMTKAGEDDQPEACTSNGAPREVYAAPMLRSVTELDTSRLYRITPSADILQTVKYAADTAQNGALLGVNAEASSVAYDVAMEALRAAVGVATMTYRRGIPALRSKPVITEGCLDTEKEAAAFNEKYKETLTCGLARRIDQCVKEETGTDLAKERAALHRLYDEAIKNKVNHRLLTTIAAYREKRIAAAEAKGQAAKARYGLIPDNPTPVAFDVINTWRGPNEFESYSDKADFTNLDSESSTTWRIEAKVPGSDEHLPVLVTLLKDSKRQYAVQTLLPESMRAFAPEAENGRVEEVCAAPTPETDTPVTAECILEQARVAQLKANARAKAMEAEDALLGNGFRYRVPITAVSTLSVKSSTDNGNIIAPVRVEHQIAQYGLIAAMPSYFRGKGGKVSIKLWPDSSGLQTAMIGVDGIPAAAITDVIKEAESGITERREKKAAAAAKAAEADPELDALRRQKEILELQKTIRDLQQAPSP